MREAVLPWSALCVGPPRLSEAPGATGLRTGGTWGSAHPALASRRRGRGGAAKGRDLQSEPEPGPEPGVRSLGPASSFHTTSQTYLRLLLRERGGCGTGHARWRARLCVRPGLSPPDLGVVLLPAEGTAARGRPGGRLRPQGGSQRTPHGEGPRMLRAKPARRGPTPDALPRASDALGGRPRPETQSRPCARGMVRPPDRPEAERRGLEGPLLVLTGSRTPGLECAQRRAGRGPGVLRP